MKCLVFGRAQANQPFFVTDQTVIAKYGFATSSRNPNLIKPYQRLTSLKAAPQPFVWLDKFFAACKNCKIDSIAAHWYACKSQYLTNYLKRYEKYKKPLWVTEFACGDGDDSQKSLAGQKTYMRETLATLEANPNVFRYSWFSSRTTAIPNADLLGGSGQLTDLGKQYLNHTEGSACAK